jgi:ADP-heptose:LPS heptosyltransferase
LVGLIGAQPPSWQPSFAVLEQDRVEAAADLPDLRAPYAMLHPGASEESRRWPADRFVQVGNALAAQGLQIVVTGVEYERALVERIAAELERPAIPAVGRLSIGGLAALLKDAALVVSNDTGPMHLANAVGTPNVAIFWCGNYMNWAHFNQRGHRPLRSWTVTCPLCGADMAPDEKPDTGCDHNARLVDGVTVEQVLTEAFDLLAYHAALPASAANRT